MISEFYPALKNLTPDFRLFHKQIGILARSETYAKKLKHSSFIFIENRC